jgi:HlyD family secretion protein
VENVKSNAKKIIGRISLAVIMLIILGIIAFLFLRPPELSVIEIAPEDVHSYFTEEGIIKNGVSVNVISEVSGNVTDVLIEEDTRVKKGDVIAHIDSKEYYRQKNICEETITGYKSQIQKALQEEKTLKTEFSGAINRLREEIKALDGQKKSAQTSVAHSGAFDEIITEIQLSSERANKDLAFARDVLEKQKILYEGGAISEIDYMNAERNFEQVKNSVAQLEDKLNERRKEAERLQSEYGAGVSDINAAGINENYDALKQANREQIAFYQENLRTDYSSHSTAYYNSLIEIEQQKINKLNDDIENCVISSPTDGYVVALPIDSKTRVSALESVAVIKTSEKSVVEVFVSTSDLSYVTEGDAVSLVKKQRLGDALFGGTVKTISEAVETYQSSLGAKDYTVKVIIDVEQDAEELKNARNLDVQFTLSDRENVFLAPNAAIETVDGENYAYKIENGAVRRVKVVAGEITSKKTIVEEGLFEGDLLIKNIHDLVLKEGMKAKAKFE